MTVDVLVIGSGGAGLSAALSANKETKKVLVLSKTYPTHSQTCQAQGGINAVLESTKDDSIENYINDTIKASHKLSNKNHVKLFCEESQNTINWLDNIGVPFSKDKESNISQRKFGGTKAQRTCYSSDYTGLKILHTLYDQCIKEDIKFLNEHLLLNFIVKNNQIQGVTALNILNSEVIQINAKSVILASGGYAGIYHNFTTNSYTTTGDGIAVALRAGAKLSNMEFVQFHPTALENKNILISESARGEGGYLVDENENRFIDELKPRDEVARAIYEKNHEGKRVFLDLRHLGLDKINETMPQERRLVEEFMQLKMENDLIPINPSAHYTMGGVLTDIETKTSIKNLYACGECSQSGIHGANRLGGNSLLEIITFGKIAGENAAKNAKNAPEIQNTSSNQYEIDKNMIEELLKNEKKEDFYSVKKDLGKLFFKNAGLFREESKLKELLDYINKQSALKEAFGIEDKSRTYNKNLVELLEFKNMIEISESIIKSALERKESRGAHYRTDFKEEKKEFDKNSISYIKDNNLVVEFEEIS